MPAQAPGRQGFEDSDRRPAVRGDGAAGPAGAAGAATTAPVPPPGVSEQESGDQALRPEASPGTVVTGIIA
jgi:hypothetical protein